MIKFATNKADCHNISDQMKFIKYHTLETVLKLTGNQKL